MSIYNRKMFKRNARNALNSSAGVQNFFNGGQINVRGRIPGARPVFASQAARVGGPSRSFGVARDGRVFTFPTTANTMSGALDLGIATKATGLPFRDFDKLDPKSPRYDPNVQKGGLGSLTVPEAASLMARQGGFAARQRAEDRFGKGAGIASAADVLGQLAGGAVGGTTQALATADTPDQDTIGGRLAGMTPSEDYLKSLGINVMDVSNRAGSQGGRSAQDVANLQAQQYQRAVDAADRNAGAVRPTTPDSPPFTDQQTEVREREDEAAAAAGEAYYDEKLGIMRPGTDPEIQRLLNEEAQRAQNEAAATEDSDIEKQERGESETETQTSSQPGTTAQTTAEVYDDAILRRARSANAAAGVPKLETATDELDAAMQAGTKSPEDIKADFLKLLPKYEEDPSVQGLNLAMMGFMIAGGTSENALENIANGMKKGLPAFIKSKEKRKAFEREVDLLASKYTIGRLEEDRKADRQKTTFFATESFELPNGEKVEEGQIFRLNDGAFNIAEQQGITKFLTSEANYGKMIAANATLEKAKLDASNTSINDLYEKSTDVEIGGQKIRVRFPSAAGEAAGMVARPSGGQAAWDAFTTGYAENLDQIRFADKGVGSAISLLDQDKALGSAGLVGKIADATKAVVPERFGKALGIDYDTLSDANQFEVIQRSLALQLAPVLLQESGKTISDNDRTRVAQALGFNIDPAGNIVFDNGIVNAFKTEEEARRSLMEVQRVLRRNATKLHSEYGKAAKLFGMKGLSTETEGAAGFVFKEGGEGDDFDLEIIAGQVMGIIRVKAPDGNILRVKIAGDQITDAEKAALLERFSGQAGTQVAAQPATPDEPALPTRDIDYDTGVQDMFFRKEFSKGDNEEERRARLAALGVNQEAIQIDDKGEFLLDRDLLTDDVKNKYNITGTGLMAIDEKKGFTRYDFADFYGEARGPLLGGLTASLAATGVGAIPAAFIAGGGTALGYLFDQYQETNEGLQRETLDEIGRGALGEFALGGVGELAGRGLAAILGRVIKGSGGESANEARAIAREVIAAGGRPTVRAANESPILGRLQAIYEGVFPNKVAAQENADFVARELSGRLQKIGITGKSADPDKLLKLLNRDIERIYGNPETILREANQNLTGMVNTEIDKLIKMFGDDAKPLDSRQIANTIDIAKRIFDEDVDVLYGQANKLLGNREVVPTGDLVKRFEQLVNENPAFNLAESGVGKFILGFKRSKDGKPLGKGLTRKATVQEMNGIRTALREAGFDPSLVGTQNGKFIGDLLGTIDRSFKNARISIREELLQPRVKGGRRAGEKVKQGLDLLDKANSFYGKGVGRFRDANAEKVFRDFRKGNLDVEALFDSEYGLLAPNRGSTLNKFFKAVVPGGRTPIETPATFDEFLQRGGIDPNVINQLPDGDYLKSTLTRKFNESRRFAEQVAAARGTGVATREAVRQSMARNYLERLARQNTNIYGTFNPSKMVDEINRLGTTGEVLFGKQHKALMNGLADLGTVNPRIADDELARMAGMPLADQIARIKGILKEQDDLANNTLAKGISRAVADRDPDKVVDLIFRKNSAATIRDAQEQLGEETMEAIREAAMNRILSQLPDKATNGKQFVDDVLNGHYSTQLERILNAYGDETIDAMFGEAGPILRGAVKKSAAVSNKEIKGLGALAPASIATGLGVTAYLTNPLVAAGTAVGLKFMSSALRSEKVLKILTRPTGVRPGKGEYDELGRLFEMAYEAGGQSLAQQSKQIPSPVPTVQSTQQQEQQRQQRQQSAFNESLYNPLQFGQLGQPPQRGTPAARISPILNPDPATQALAQSLGRSNP